VHHSSQRKVLHIIMDDIPHSSTHKPCLFVAHKPAEALMINCRLGPPAPLFALAAAVAPAPGPAPGHLAGTHPPAGICVGLRQV
jgi:hypothetical protein